MTKAEADTLARMWANNEVAPEDFDPDLRQWKTEQAIREAIALGEMSHKQFIDELERREHAGRMGHESQTFVDRYPSIFVRRRGDG